MSWLFVSYLLALLAASIACITDLRARRIPNWITLPSLCAGLSCAAWHDGLVGALSALGAALLCFAPGYFLFTRGALGGGDVKLFAALGALVGARDGLELQLSAFVLVSCFALLSMAFHGRLLALLRASGAATLHLLSPSRFARPSTTRTETQVPMGLAILIATCVLCLRGLS